MYAKNAIQPTSTITPNYISDLFGVGINGFKFGLTDVFSLPNHDGFILGDVDGNQAFTIEMTVRFTTPTTASRNIIQKYQNSAGNADWRCVLYGGTQIRFLVYSEGSPTNYIGCKYTWTPTVNQVYNLKFVYTGGTSKTSCLFYLDGVRCVSGQDGSGTFTRIGNTPQPINIGRYVYLPVEDVTNIKYTKGLM